MKKLLSILVFSFLFGGSGYAVTNKDFLIYKNSEINSQKKEDYRVLIYSYLLGAAHSYLSTNAVLQLKNENKLFCQPGDLSLNLDNYTNFVQEQINKEKKDGSYNDEAPLSATLLKRLEKVFPCN